MSLVIGCVLLAPSIILGYAVKAADRDDRERVCELSVAAIAFLVAR